jgi:hypothetical protein
VPLDELPHLSGLGVHLRHSDQAQALAEVALMQPLQMWNLHIARRSRGTPEVEQHHLPP